MPVLNNRETWLVSGLTASATGKQWDNRNCANYSYLYYSAGGASAVFDLRASHDGATWLVAATYTATTGAAAAGTAAIAAFYPYVQVNGKLMYSGAAGSATLSVYWSPGYV